jgi:hypothetical protein
MKCVRLSTTVYPYTVYTYLYLNSTLRIVQSTVQKQCKTVFTGKLGELLELALDSRWSTAAVLSHCQCPTTAMHVLRQLPATILLRLQS